MDYTLFFDFGGDILKKNNKNNFYVMDHCIKNSENDQFGHTEIADNIVNLINNDKYIPPYNIALIGRWGLGKSSILKIVKEKLSNINNIKTIEINAWKYERESLKNEYLKKIYEEVSGEKVSFIQQLEIILDKIFRNDKQKNKSKKEIFVDLWKKTWPILLASAILSAIWQFANYISNGSSFGELLKNNLWYLLCKYLNFYFEKILFTLCIPTLVALIPNLLSKESNIYPLQINYDNDYETLLKNIIQKKKNYKFIIIIDDLDRLSTKKMVEALDTLKILMEIDRCIFIVPFDDSILKNALNKKVVSEINNEQQIIQSEFILDKLFQFRFYVPPLIISDMKQYTLDIIKDESNDLYDIFAPEEIDEIVKKIFMYDGVQTPRQIKKIINTFSNNILLFKERIEKNKINSDLFNKNGKLMIAKISVLQSDFNDFYDDLFNEPTLCEELIKANKKNYSEYKEIPNKLRKYYKRGKIEFKEEYDKLLNFLSRTAYIKSEDISIYLRCNQEKISIIFGSDFNRKLLSSMRSMNFILMNKIIKESNISSIEELLINYLEVETIYNLPMVIVSILNIDTLDINNTKFCKSYINSISNVYNSGETLDLQYINLNKLFELKNKYFDNHVLINLLNQYIEFLNKNIDNDEIEHKDIYQILIKNIKCVSNIETENIKKYFNTLYHKEYYYIELLNNKNIDALDLENYFGIQLYEYTLDLISECEDDDAYQTYCDLIIRMYEILKHSVENRCINKQIIDLLSDIKNIQLCETIIVNNSRNFSDNEQIQILEKIKKMNDDDLLLQYNILNSISFDIDKEDNELQNKICEFIENDYDIGNILNNICDYKFIDIVVKKMNNIIYVESKYDSIYSKNIKKFSREQLENLIKILSSTINKETYIEGRITSILNIVEDFVAIDEIITVFTKDEMIKNTSASNEIANIIKKIGNINAEKVNSFIKRNIELLTINKSTIVTLEKLTSKISNDNLKLLTSTINNGLVENMSNDELNSLFNIYRHTLIDDNNKDSITTGLNTLINSEIENQVIKYMKKNNIQILNSFDFIIKRIDNIERLKKYDKLSEILFINEDFVDNLIKKINEKEYSTEQLLYFISLDEKILNRISKLELNYDITNLNQLLNIQKIISSIRSENDLVNFQKNILKNGDNNLLENIIEKFIPIKKPENRKIIRESLEEKISDRNISNLLSEKIIIFSKINKYRNIKKTEKELVES